jgi:hypothetical protein
MTGGMPCCFDEVAIDDMVVSCRDEGHLLSRRLKSMSRTKSWSGKWGSDIYLFALRTQMFSRTAARPFQNLSRKGIKVLRKYDELQFQVSIEREPVR